MDTERERETLSDEYRERDAERWIQRETLSDGSRERERLSDGYTERERETLSDGYRERERDAE